jgi:Fe-S-cluster containining protein
MWGEDADMTVRNSNRIMLSQKVIRELLDISDRHRLSLKEAYGLIPITRCQRRVRCCSLLPEMSFIEALAALRCLGAMEGTKRMQVIRRFARYFFSNAVQITSCPFLEGADCLIYPGRFFGCRAYGLWSQGFYEKEASRSSQTKQVVREQWQNMGISLPQAVVDFAVPYCPNVSLEGNAEAADGLLLEVSEKIDGLSRQLTPWNEIFQQKYFSDLSFLLASLALGHANAVQLKFAVIRDIVNTGKWLRLDKIIEEFPDICEGFV